MKLIYVAGPFRAANAWEIEQNIRRAETLALEAWKCGVSVICPHANTRFFSGAAPDEVWLEGDLEILGRCDAILMTPDWRTSSGAIGEHNHARENDIARLFSIEDLKEWLHAEAAADANAAARIDRSLNGYV